MFKDAFDYVVCSCFGSLNLWVDLLASHTDDDKRKFDDFGG